MLVKGDLPWQQGSWGQHGAHLGPRWTPYRPYEPCYLGWVAAVYTLSKSVNAHVVMPSGVLCDIEYPSENHLQLISRKISFAHNIQVNILIVLQFCIENCSITAVLCTKFQNVWTIETDVMDERVFARFEFMVSFGSGSYIVQHPRAYFFFHKLRLAATASGFGHGYNLRSIDYSITYQRPRI